MVLLKVTLPTVNFIGHVPQVSWRFSVGPNSPEFAHQLVREHHVKSIEWLAALHLEAAEVGEPGALLFGQPLAAEGEKATRPRQGEEAQLRVELAMVHVAKRRELVDAPQPEQRFVSTVLR